MQQITKNIPLGITLIASLLTATPLNAAQLPLWSADGWTLMSNPAEDTTTFFVDPGWGGQDFDAEYLFYKFDSATRKLSIGLQTGFDLLDGKVNYRGRDYYAGDLAISFDGDTNNYEYAIDFGLYTANYYGVSVDAGSGTGIDAAGIYQAAGWNNEIYFNASAPFAMDNGSLDASIMQTAGYSSALDSYFRTVTFDLDDLDVMVDLSDLDAHWTMSCGNDEIIGHTSVPEPGTLLLMLTGLVGLVGSRRIKLDA